MEKMDSEFMQALNVQQQKTVEVQNQCIDEKGQRISLEKQLVIMDKHYQRESAINRSELMKLESDNSTLKFQLEELEAQLVRDLEIKDQIQETHIQHLKQ